MLRGGQEIQGCPLSLFVPILLYGISPSLPRTCLFPPCHIFQAAAPASSCLEWFSLLSAGLTSQGLVSPAVLRWDLRPPYPGARDRRGRESLQPPGPAPSNIELINSKQNTDCGGNWFCPGLSWLRLRLRRWIRDLERKRSREVISVLLDKEIFLCPSQTSRCFSIHLDKEMFLYPFRQVGISLSI